MMPDESVDEQPQEEPPKIEPPVSDEVAQAIHEMFDYLFSGKTERDG